MKKLRQMNGNLSEAAGSLAYIPSEVRVWKVDKENEIVSDSVKVCEPCVVPLIAISSPPVHAQIYYNGTLWWADIDDLYGVER